MGRNLLGNRQFKTADFSGYDPAAVHRQILEAKEKEQEEEQEADSDEIKVERWERQTKAIVKRAGVPMSHLSDTLRVGEDVKNIVEPF